jgi:hypothetical protein
VTVTDPPSGATSHVSYSALNDFLGCGKYFQLKRLIGLPDRPSWWNVGGHAVHSATEAFDRQMYAEYGA